ncbi:MAG: VWA domain-containing protein [Oligoflexia bacterium]|nr:VWA domain-containing protein [Oligoflexia bacterium]
MPVVWLVFALVARWQHERFSKLFAPRVSQFINKTVSLAKRRWHLVLQVLVLTFLALALARPQFGTKQTEVKQTGFEIILAVDVSNSMLAEDMKPSRLSHAKKMIHTLLDQLEGSRIGLIAFAGTAHMVSPMTTDIGALKMYVSSLSPDSVSSQGTNFSDVLAESVRAFKDGGIENETGARPTRVVLFFSDGEDHEKGINTAIKKATDEGVRIFGLGFGTAQGAPIPERDDRGNLRGYKKDDNGQVVMSIPNDNVLASMAKEGRGAYYHSTFEQTELKNLLSDINRLEKTDFKSRLSQTYDERFQFPLAIALVFGILDLMFGDRRRERRTWSGRFQP